MLVNGMGCYFSGWGVSLRDGVLVWGVTGWGVTFRDGVLVYGMGC